MTVSEIVDRLGGGRRNGTSWTVRCQAHDDSTASVSVSEGRDGAVLVKDHGGCPTEAVLAAVGLGMADLFPSSDESARLLIDTYDYADADGALLYQVVRYMPKDFRQRRPDGAGGWTWSLNGVERVLYRLPELRAADPRRTVLVVEGERDADRLISLGFIATTNAGGAGKWRPEYADELRGRRVAILPDNDGPGGKHAQDVARSLVGVASEVRIIELPGLPPKGDVSDWLDAGGTADGLKRIVRETSPMTAETHSSAPDAPSGRMEIAYLTARQLAEQTPEDIAWIARPWVAAGAITELDGRPKAAGKSTLLSYMIRSLLDGAPFLGQPTRRTPVVLLSEQGPTSLRATLGRAGLLERDDLYLVLWRDARGTSWSRVAEQAVALCHGSGAQLLVIDTLPQFAGLAGDSENDSGAAFEAMEPLQAAAAAGLGIVVSRHDRKGGGEVGESARGSGAFTGAVDVVLALRRGDGESRPTIRHLHALSRFEETPAELVIELTEQGFVALGSAVNFAVEEAKAAILAVLGDEAMTTAALVEATELKRTAVYAAVEELFGAGRLERVGAGKRGDPFRYSTRPRSFGPEPIADAYRSGRMNDASSRDPGMDVVAEARRIFGDDLAEPGMVA